MVLVLDFHTKDPDRVGDTLNIFLFTDLSPLAGLEAALLTRKWDAILVGSILKSFAEMILLMGKQKVTPIVVWGEAASQIEAWAVFCTVFLGDNSGHPATYEMFCLIEETFSVSPWLWVQAHQQLAFPVVLFCLVQQEFDEIFRQALERKQQVQWPNFDSLWRALATGNLRPDLVSLPGGIAPSERPPPLLSAPRRLPTAAPPDTPGNPPPPLAQNR